MVAAPASIDTLCVNSIRMLAVDAINKSKSGHPGLPMGCAPMGYALWDKFLKHNPKNPKWFNRDRFVLSAGHGCMLLYALLHLTGYDSVSIDDIKTFRQWGSKAPGHPETFETPGVEVTTGPLGAGISNAVGLAIAEARGATVLAEVVGYGTTCDAHHITAPTPGGVGGAAAIRLALEDGQISADSVDYVNAHGTSTPANDKNETSAIKSALGSRALDIAVSSTKSMTGHLLGGSGGIEAVACVLALQNGLVPPTINHSNPDPDCDLDVVPNQARELKLGTVLSNSFGFGGHNVCLAFRHMA